MFRRVLQRLLRCKASEDDAASKVPFEATLASYNDKWVIMRDEQLMGATVLSNWQFDLHGKSSMTILTQASSSFMVQLMTRFYLV